MIAFLQSLLVGILWLFAEGNSPSHTYPYDFYLDRPTYIKELPFHEFTQANPIHIILYVGIRVPHRIAIMC